MERLRILAFGLAAMLLGAPAGATQRRFAVDPLASSVVVHVGRAGLFGFLGHDHVVEAPIADGIVVANDQALSESSVELSFRAADLLVTDPEGPEEDVPEVQSKMESADVLDVERHPIIRFASSEVSGEMIEADAWRLRVKGTLELHGVARPLTVPLAVRLVEHGLAAAGEVELRQSLWGIRPVSVAGVVKVKDELRIRFEIQARPISPD